MIAVLNASKLIWLQNWNSYYLYLTSVFMFEGRSLGRYIILTYSVMKIQLLAKVLGKCSMSFMYSMLWTT